MKDLIKKILRESLEEEIRQKDNIGVGRDHVVYNFEKTPNKIIKVAYEGEWGKPESLGQLKASHLETMITYPDIFPKVYKYNNNYAIIEKLNTSNIEEEDEKLFEAIARYDLGMFKSFTQESAIETVFWHGMKTPELLRRVIDLINRDKRVPKDVKELVYKYMTFFLKINQEIPNSTQLDVHVDNIGYDSNGNLKLLDF